VASLAQAALGTNPTGLLMGRDGHHCGE
jgi:hypothetical protein